MTDSLKVVHLCTVDYGGAGKAAYRLHRGLLEIGVDSTMLVLAKKSGDPTVKVIPVDRTGAPAAALQDSARSAEVWQQTFRHWQDALERVYPGRPSGAELFSDPYTLVSLEGLEEIRRADVINLHWVAGLIDYREFPAVTHGKSLVWTLHDMNPFTGGCHYAGDCRNYCSACGTCPQLGSNQENDRSRSVWGAKKSLYEALDLHVVTPSRWLGECAQSSSLFEGFPCSVVPYGLPTEVFQPYSPEACRQALGIPANALVVLFGVSAGTLRKGFVYLAQALDMLPDPLKERIVLLSFGSFDPQRLSTRMQSIHVGQVADEDTLAKLYSAADLFVLPSLEDNLPNTVLEALSCGVPVAAFASGGIPDMVQHQRTGYLVPPTDVPALANGIVWCLEQGSTLRAACRASALERYPLATQARAYLGLYRTLRSDAATGAAAQDSAQRPVPATTPVSSYFQPPAGSTESFVDVRPFAGHSSTCSAYQALKDYPIRNFGTGFDAVKQIIRHIFDNKLHTPLTWRDDLWLRSVVARLTCDLSDRRTGQRFSDMGEPELTRFGQEFLAAEGADRAPNILAYREQLLQGVDLGQPLYVSGAVLNSMGAAVDPCSIFMLDGARRVSASALARRETIDIQLIVLEEEFSAQLLDATGRDALLKEINQLSWFNNYQSIPLVGIRGERSLNRFSLMDMSLLRDQTIMDFGCNLGQACIKGVMAGAREVWGVEGMPDTYRIATQIGRLSGFQNLHYLNVDFNAPDFGQQIDAACPDQVDYTFFFSVYRTKELTQRDTLFRYIIQKSRKGIFFEGHADAVIDTINYYDWLFESFGLTYRFLGNSEGSLRPLFFIPLADRQAAPPPSPTVPKTTGGGLQSSAPSLFRVSAIVSTYASERFIEGRLKDLLNQTLGDKLEIIVIDSNSPENERAIVERYAARHTNIVYIRTDQRETVYQAWNRGAQAARGTYLTNANTDDRLRPDALEILASELDANPSIALVYADFFITGYENMPFDRHIRTGYSIKPDYAANIMLHGCHMGPQPMWRRSLHDELGYFDETLVAAGDYEFWCRVACRYPMKHVPQFLGLYLHNPKGICNSDTDRCSNESQQVKEHYRRLFPAPRLDLPTGCYYREKAVAGKFVNIGMVTYNRLDFTQETIVALVRHTDFPYVLTVVDNGSTDGTREYLTELKRLGVVKNLILLDGNVGVAKASNLAWSLEPTAEYYLKLDNDIVIQKPGWLAPLVQAVDVIHQIGAAGYNFEPTSYELREVAGIRLRIKLNGNLGGACILIPRRTHERLGFWCEDYGLYGEEDADLGMRLQRCGLINVYMPDEEIGIHLPAGRAATIDPLTYSASDGREESEHAEYRQWKDDRRRENVQGGLLERNFDRYLKDPSSLYIASPFAAGWLATHPELGVDGA